MITVQGDVMVNILQPVQFQNDYNHKEYYTASISSFPGCCGAYILYGFHEITEDQYRISTIIDKFRNHSIFAITNQSQKEVDLDLIKNGFKKITTIPSSHSVAVYIPLKVWLRLPNKGLREDETG